MTAYRIEALLSPRLHQSPQRAGDRLYFVSNLSGHLSLYGMDLGGGIPNPLLPPDIALHNPHLMDGDPFYTFPSLGRILVMLDHDGDEVYQPHVIPLEGGYPEPAFGGRLAGHRVHLTKCDPAAAIAYFSAESLHEQLIRAFRGNLRTGDLVELGASRWGSWVGGASPDHRQVILIDSYTVGDHVLYLWRETDPHRALLYGVPMESRPSGQTVPLNSIHSCWFTPGGGVLCSTSLFEDTYGPGYFRLDDPAGLRPVPVHGVVHEGVGEFSGVRHLDASRYLLVHNIDGCSWAYVAAFDEGACELHVERVLCGQPPLVQGVLDAIRYDKSSATFAVSFSTANVADAVVHRWCGGSARPYARTHPGDSRGAPLARRGCILHIA